jgi:hypothetical protein
VSPRLLALAAGTLLLSLLRLLTLLLLVVQRSALVVALLAGVRVEVRSPIRLVRVLPLRLARPARVVAGLVTPLVPALGGLRPLALVVVGSAIRLDLRTTLPLVAVNGLWVVVGTTAVRSVRRLGVPLREVVIGLLAAVVLVLAG